MGAWVFIKKKIIYFWLRWVFVAVWAFPSCDKQRLMSSCNAWASDCSGFSCCGEWALEHLDFRSCGSWGLEHRLNSCGTQAWFAPRHVGSSLIRDGTLVSSTGRRILYQWATREALFNYSLIFLLHCVSPLLEAPWREGLSILTTQPPGKTQLCLF